MESKDSNIIQIPREYLNHAGSTIFTMSREVFQSIRNIQSCASTPSAVGLLFGSRSKNDDGQTEVSVTHFAEVRLTSENGPLVFLEENFLKAFNDEKAKEDSKILVGWFAVHNTPKLSATAKEITTHKTFFKHPLFILIIVSPEQRDMLGYLIQNGAVKSQRIMIDGDRSERPTEMIEVQFDAEAEEESLEVDEAIAILDEMPEDSEEVPAEQVEKKVVAPKTTTKTAAIKKPERTRTFEKATAIAPNMSSQVAANRAKTGVLAGVKADFPYRKILVAGIPLVFLIGLMAIISLLVNTNTELRSEVVNLSMENRQPGESAEDILRNQRPPARPMDADVARPEPQARPQSQPIPASINPVEVNAPADEPVVKIPAKVEMKPDVPQEPREMIGGHDYEIENGDSLWKIAKKVYGRGSRWKVIADANNLTETSVLKIGTKINIPQIEK